MDDVSVIGDWIKEKILGSGSFGVVSLWHNIKSKQNLAVKMCKWSDPAVLTAKHKERWTQEVKMMNTMDNSNIVGTRELPEDLLRGLIPYNISYLPILCMEYCTSGDLRQVLMKPESSSGLPEQEVRCILADMKNAVSHLHQLKITHRDLKPENIVLQTLPHAGAPGPSYRKYLYKLIDLGYSKEIDSNSVCGSFVGTLQYLAPELFYSKTYSNTVDYWSFGIMAFEIICGVRPFLPNMSPAQWIPHVKRKTSQHICVYEKLNGEIQLSTNMFTENQISGQFQKLMEKWLCIALEWDPKRRGHSTDDRSVKFSLPGDDAMGDHNMIESAKDDAVELFTSLEAVLLKKIIIIFSVPTYEYLSYEIDDTTDLSTLQGWIKRDTNVASENQVLILPSVDDRASDNNVASALWNDSNSVMLFLYQNDSLINENIKPIFPENIRQCLREPKACFSYNHILTIFSDCLYFVNKERQLNESLVKAYIRRLQYLKTTIKKFCDEHNDSEKKLWQLNDKQIIMSAILDFNKEKISSNKNNMDLSSYIQAYKLWTAKCEASLEKINKLKEAWNQLSTRLQSVARRSNEISEDEICTKLNANGLQDVCKLATSLYNDALRVPKDRRGNKFPCLNAIHIIYKCIKLRDGLVANGEAQKISQKIIDIHVETEKMSSIIVKAGAKADDLSKEITDLLIEKEMIIWNQMENASSGQHNLPRTLPIQVQHTNGQASLTSFRIGEPVRSPNASVVLTDKAELKSLIKENVTLRQSAQEALKKSFQTHKSIQDDIMMDFSSLC